MGWVVAGHEGFFLVVVAAVMRNLNEELVTCGKSLLWC